MERVTYVGDKYQLNINDSYWKSLTTRFIQYPWMTEDPVKYGERYTTRSAWYYQQNFLTFCFYIEAWDIKNYFFGKGFHSKAAPTKLNEKEKDLVK